MPINPACGIIAAIVSLTVKVAPLASEKLGRIASEISCATDAVVAPINWALACTIVTPRVPAELKSAKCKVGSSSCALVPANTPELTVMPVNPRPKTWEANAVRLAPVSVTDRPEVAPV